ADEPVLLQVLELAGHGLNRALGGFRQILVAGPGVGAVRVGTVAQGLVDELGAGVADFHGQRGGPDFQCHVGSPSCQARETMRALWSWAAAVTVPHWPERCLATFRSISPLRGESSS